MLRVPTKISSTSALSQPRGLARDASTQSSLKSAMSTSMLSAPSKIPLASALYPSMSKSALVRSALIGATRGDAESAAQEHVEQEHAENADRDPAEERRETDRVDERSPPGACRRACRERMPA